MTRPHTLLTLVFLKTILIRITFSQCPILIDGREGFNEAINGQYDVDGEFDEKPQYFDEDDDIFVYWNRDLEFWLIGDTLGSTVVFAYGDDNKPTPEEVDETWIVWGGDDDGWVTDSAITVDCDGPAVPAPPPPTPGTPVPPPPVVTPPTPPGEEPTPITPPPPAEITPPPPDGPTSAPAEEPTPVPPSPVPPAGNRQGEESSPPPGSPGGFSEIMENCFWVEINDSDLDDDDSSPPPPSPPYSPSSPASPSSPSSPSSPRSSPSPSGNDDVIRDHAAHDAIDQGHDVTGQAFDLLESTGEVPQAGRPAGSGARTAKGLPNPPDNSETTERGAHSIGGMKNEDADDGDDKSHSKISATVYNEVDDALQWRLSEIAPRAVHGDTLDYENDFYVFMCDGSPPTPPPPSPNDDFISFFREFFGDGQDPNLGKGDLPQGQMDVADGGIVVIEDSPDNRHASDLSNIGADRPRAGTLP